MTAGALAGNLLVPVFGVLLVAVPVLSPASVRFGVRVPSGHAGDTVLDRERRGYLWRSAVIALVATGLVLAAGRGAPVWLSRVVLLAQVAADACCFWWAHRRITRVKTAEGWFAGRRQTVVADTSWRTEPARYPVAWLLPAAAVIAATIVVGVLRYPALPAHLLVAGRPVPTSPGRVFAVVVAQLYVTGLWSALLALVQRARPDLGTADPAGSLRAHRRVLRTFTRAALLALAGVDATLLLASLGRWQVWSAPAPLLVLPAVLGIAGFLVVAVRTRPRPHGDGGCCSAASWGCPPGWS